MTPVILIPARMAATRLPNKPLADINGLPMIVHVWQRAVASEIGDVFVACDDERIVQAIEKAGGKAIITDNNHASGSDRIYEALNKIPNNKKYDVIVNVQGDVQTIDPQIIKEVLKPLEFADIATLACKITVEAEKTDPSVVKPVLAFNSPTLANALYFSRATLPHGAGDIYHHIGIYAYKRHALEKFVSLPPSRLELREKLEQLRALEADMKIGVAIVDTIPLGVDTHEHLQKARELCQSL